VRICKSLVHVLAVPFSLTFLACSSVKAEKGPFRDDDWLEPGNGNATGSGTVSGGSGGSGSTGTGGTSAGTGGGGTGSSGGGPPGCQTFDYTNYRAPAAMISLKTDILPIFSNATSAGCALSICHSNSAPNSPKLGPANGMVDAVGLEAIRNALLASSTQVPGLKLVSPGKPEESYLMNKIDGTFSCMGFACQTAAGCGERMPQLLPPLETDKINKIRDWIKQGAPAM